MLEPLIDIENLGRKPDVEEREEFGWREARGGWLDSLVDKMCSSYKTKCRNE